MTEPNTKMKNYMIVQTEELIKEVKALKRAGCIADDDLDYPAFLENLRYALEILKPSR